MVISGKELAAKLKAEMAEQVAEFPGKYGRVPHLVVILVGNDPGSQTYVRNKEKACDVVGFKHTTYRFPEDTPEQEVLDRIAELNADDSVDGILVQLPLPRHISETKVIEAIAKEKDVDGFHPLNTAALWQKRPNNTCVVPCTPMGIIKLLEEGNVEIAGKKAVVLGRSQIVGLPISKLLLDRNATVTICHSRTKDLAEVTSQADILVAAIGKAKFVTGDMVKEGAAEGIRDHSSSRWSRTDDYLLPDVQHYSVLLESIHTEVILSFCGLFPIFVITTGNNLLQTVQYEENRQFLDDGRSGCRHGCAFHGTGQDRQEDHRDGKE